MARLLNRLNARKMASLETAGRHADGSGLYLSISGEGRRRWVFLYRWHGRLREMGLGSPRDVALARARELVAQGQDPLEARRTARTIKTFGTVADEFIATMQVQWRNEKHAAQWQTTLREYAASLQPLAVSPARVGEAAVRHRQAGLRPGVGRLTKARDALEPVHAARPRRAPAGLSPLHLRRQRRHARRQHHRPVGGGRGGPALRRPRGSPGPVGLHHCVQPRAGLAEGTEI